MKNEEDGSNNNNNNDCPPIEIAMHQNSYRTKNTEKRGSNENE